MYNLIAGALTFFYGIAYLLFGGVLIISMLEGGVLPGINMPEINGLILSAGIQGAVLFMLSGLFQAWYGWQKKAIAGPARYMPLTLLVVNFLSYFGVAFTYYPELLQFVLPLLALFVVLISAQILALVKKEIQMA